MEDFTPWSRSMECNQCWGQSDGTGNKAIRHSSGTTVLHYHMQHTFNWTQRSRWAKPNLSLPTTPSYCKCFFPKTSIFSCSLLVFNHPPLAGRSVLHQLPATLIPTMFWFLTTPLCSAHPNYCLPIPIIVCPSSLLSAHPRYCLPSPIIVWPYPLLSAHPIIVCPPCYCLHSPLWSA